MSLIFVATRAHASQSNVSRTILRNLSTRTLLFRSQWNAAAKAQPVAQVPYLLTASPLHISKNSYASKKGKKGKKGAKAEVEEEEDDYEQEVEVSKEQEEESGFELADYTPKFQACLDKLKRDFQTLRMGRANPGNISASSCLSTQRSSSRFGNRRLRRGLWRRDAPEEGRPSVHQRSPDPDDQCV